MRLQVWPSTLLRRSSIDPVRPSADEAIKVGKDAIASLLAPAKDVIAVLDVVSQLHPAVQVKYDPLDIILKFSELISKVAVGVIKVRHSFLLDFHH